MEYKTKDSGKRINYKSGMLRDTSKDKPRFDLIIPINQKYEETLLYRWAMLLMRGAQKYSERNWEKANSIEELSRAKESAFRHFIQAISGETDEDHFAAVCFNLNEVIYIMNKLGVDVNGNKVGKD
jgi:hypothetical protein